MYIAIESLVENSNHLLDEITIDMILDSRFIQSCYDDLFYEIEIFGDSYYVHFRTEEDMKTGIWHSDTRIFELTSQEYRYLLLKFK